MQLPLMIIAILQAKVKMKILWKNEILKVILNADL